MKKFHYYLQISFMVIILTTLISCSTGYNKPADQYYEEGLLFYEQMEYDRSFDILKFRGEAYQKGNDFDHAIKDYSDAIALVPNYFGKTPLDFCNILKLI